MFCRERNIPEHVQSVSPRFQEGIRAFSESPIIGEVYTILESSSNIPTSFWIGSNCIQNSYCLQLRGTGLILGTEFSQNKSPNEPFPSEWGNS